MRPIKLTISAFGPYASKQVIDFEELKGRNIFVISGKTGAGNTGTATRSAKTHYRRKCIYREDP